MRPAMVDGAPGTAGSEALGVVASATAAGRMLARAVAPARGRIQEGRAVRRKTSCSSWSAWRAAVHATAIAAATFAICAMMLPGLFQLGSGARGFTIHGDFVQPVAAQDLINPAPSTASTTTALSTPFAASSLSSAPTLSTPTTSSSPTTSSTVCVRCLLYTSPSPRD